jgi:hypothetical protein
MPEVSVATEVGYLHVRHVIHISVLQLGGTDYPLEKGQIGNQPHEMKAGFSPETSLTSYSLRISSC